MKSEARRVGRYRILRVLGRGGMATVYLARQTDLDREVALKELALFESAGPDVARRFLREARLAGSFSHPNIVTVHEYLEHSGTPYIAMEYLPRGSLRPYVGRMSLAQVANALTGVLGALSHAEERDVVHRDLKPENIMVTAQGGVKIADFGIAKATSAAQTTNLTMTGTTLGTPRYMSPERALGQAVGPWSDLYSVGAIAFELLVGHAPFNDTEEPMAILMRQINDPIPPVRSLVPDVDPELSSWIERLLEKDVGERTRSAAAAADELDEILARVLGPRWMRRAALPARPGDPTSVVSTPASAPSLSTSGLPAAVTGSRTIPPEPRMRPRDRRRRPRLALVAIAVAAVTGAAAIGDRGLSVIGDRTAGHSGLVTGTDAHREGLTTASTPGARAEHAEALADGYARAADRLDSEDDRAPAMERAARAYRDAAEALRREDGSDYDDALERATAAEGALSSRSDDADEDEPDEDENGD